jgi:Holliday junction resolvasome RuvABC ATP-dependent DNA helicase subunit
MLGFLINQKESKELEYLIKREMDEILFDLKDERIDHVIKRSMKERYKILFSLFKRVASPAECMKYMATDKKSSRKSY